MPLHHEESRPCCHMGPIHTLFFVLYALYHYYFAIILIIAQNRNGIWLHIHCRKLANRHIHHRGSVSIQTMSIRDSFINVQRAVPHDVSCRNRSIGIGLADVRQLSRTQFRLELITQSIDGRGNGCTLFLPDVIGDSEFDTDLRYN